MEIEKHTLLCLTLRDLFRDKDFMTMLNRMGYCKSYTFSLELETALANAVMQSGSLLNHCQTPDPNIRFPDGLIHSWWDNFDKNVNSAQEPLQSYNIMARVAPAEIHIDETTRAQLYDYCKDTMYIKMVLVLARCMMNGVQMCPGLGVFVSITGYMQKILPHMQ